MMFEKKTWIGLFRFLKHLVLNYHFVALIGSLIFLIFGFPMFLVISLVEVAFKFYENYIKRKNN